MGSKVSDVMTGRPRAVTPQTPLTAVAELMEAEDVGSLPVVEEDRLVGIVTDRDIFVRGPRLFYREAHEVFVGGCHSSDLDA